MGYAPHAVAGQNSGNSRNGYTGKRVETERGSFDLEVPRDRNGTFEPQIVKKRQRRMGGIDEAIIHLYAHWLLTVPPAWNAWLGN